VRLTIVGGGRDAWAHWRGGTQSKLRARRACDTWSAGPSTSPLDRTVPTDTSLSFFNRGHAAQGFMVLGAIFGFFALISLLPDLSAELKIPSSHWAWAAVAVACWAAASITSHRIGFAVVSALTAALLAGVFLCARAALMSGNFLNLGVLLFGLIAVVAAYLLRQHRKFWGAV